MDKTGPIGPGTVEQLVLWAKDDRFRGSIDVRGEHAASLHFSAGFIAHIDSGHGDPAPPESDTKERVHARLAERLAGLLAFDEGSYVIQRSDELPPEARWLFGPQGLLDNAKAAATRSAPSRWHDAVVTIDDTGIGGVVQMSDDAFRIVAAMARSMRARAVQTELGWGSDRLDRALDELANRGLVAPLELEEPVVEPDVVDLRRVLRAPRPAPTQAMGPAQRSGTDLPVRPPAPPAAAPRAAEARPAPGPAPLTAARDAADDASAGTGSRTRASALRRLIQNLR